MADLAYLVATEHDALRAAANLAVRSLRRFGQFSGDIVVFTDRLFALPDDVEQLVLAPHELERSALKCRAGSKLDLESYQRVLYLDADILVRSSLDGILARCRDRVVCTDDMGLTTRMDFFSRCFSEADLASLGDLPGVNAGFFCAPGARLREWLRIWEHAIAEHAHMPGAGIDQPPFNFSLRKGLIPFDLVPDQMWFPRYHPNSPDLAGRTTLAYERTQARGPLAHYCGLRVRPDQLTRMRAEYAWQWMTRPLRGPTARTWTRSLAE
jgi:hypothetical protein